MINVSDVGTSHSLLLTFCRDVEKMYGTARVTPNMHMHTHLTDCVLDYTGLFMGFGCLVLSVIMVYWGIILQITNR